jgi:hypothetical protein
MLEWWQSLTNFEKALPRISPMQQVFDCEVV